jgi:hypothetical protein
MRVSLESFNLRGYFVRHANYLGELSKVESDLDRNDATFDMVDGLADRNAKSLQSVNFPTHFLRHQEFSVKLHGGPRGVLVDPAGPPPPPEPPDMQLMRQDATFVIVGGLAAPGDQEWVSFRSFNKPELFLRHMDFHLFAHPVKNHTDEMDATFRIVTGFVPEPLVK